MQIVSRAEWGARHADGAGPAPLPAAEVWLHHSVTLAPDLFPPFDDEHTAMRTLEAIGQQRFGQGISYTFAVMPTGRVYQGHSVDRLGAHTKDRNGTARAIVFVGDHERTAPTEQQATAAAQLLDHGHRQGWWAHPRLAGGHRQIARTACPGRYAQALVEQINDQAAALAGGRNPGGFLMALDDQQQEHLYRMIGALHAVTVHPSKGGDGEVLARLRTADAGVAALLARDPKAGAGVTAAMIAEAIPDGIAQEVVDELLGRLAE